MTTGEKRDPPKIFVVSWEDTTCISTWHDEDELADFIDNRRLAVFERRLFGP